MAASLALSLLVHGLVLYSLAAWFLPKPIQPGKDSLEVRLMLWPQTDKAPVSKPAASKQDERLLAGQTPSEFEISTPVQEVVKPPIEQPTAPPVGAAAAPDVAAEPVPPASTPQGEAAGVSIPGAVASPWGGSVRANQFRQQDYYRQMMEPRAMQQFEQQTQLFIGQLYRLLGERIRAQGGDVEGKCELAGLADGRDKRLVCEPSSLWALLKSDEKDVMEMLLVLRTRGKMFDGFSVAFRDGQPNLELHVEEPREH